jgi:hypothetical protein
MFGLSYFKGQPTDYIQRFSSGAIRKEGLGLAFYYWRYNTQIVAVPTTSRDADFLFNEITSNFQEVTLQGQLTYRIAEPKKAASLLNLRIDPDNYTYASDDLNSLAQKIINVVRIETRSEAEKRTLAEVLRDSRAIARVVEQRVREGEVLNPLGVELLSVFFLSARPTPEVAKALEAEYRESLMRQADEAIYARRGGRRGTQDQGETTGERQGPGTATANADRLARRQRPEGGGKLRPGPGEGGAVPGPRHGAGAGRPAQSRSEGLAGRRLRELGPLVRRFQCCANTLRKHADPSLLERA